MCDTCGCKKKAESGHVNLTNIHHAEKFWESESFKQWADEEMMEHGDVTFENWADQELGESSHQSSGKLTFEDWAEHENTELAHGAEGDEMPTKEELGWDRASTKAMRKQSKSQEGVSKRKALRQYLQRAKDAESFELHDWYDDMSDYGVMGENPRIQEQKDEYLKTQQEQSKAYKINQMKTQESINDRRLRNIERAVGKSNDLITPANDRMPMRVRARMPELPLIPPTPSYFKYAALLTLAGVIGYKVASK